VRDREEEMRKQQGGWRALLWFYTTGGWGRRYKQTDAPPGVNISWYRHLESRGNISMILHRSILKGGRNNICESFMRIRISFKNEDNVESYDPVQLITVMYCAALVSGGWVGGPGQLVPLPILSRCRSTSISPNSAVTVHIFLKK
jgi:hypothetical protein